MSLRLCHTYRMVAKINTIAFSGVSVQVQMPDFLPAFIIVGYIE